MKKSRLLVSTSLALCAYGLSSFANASNYHNFPPIPVIEQETADVTAANEDDPRIGGYAANVTQEFVAREKAKAERARLATLDEADDRNGGYSVTTSAEFYEALFTEREKIRLATIDNSDPRDGGHAVTPSDGFLIARAIEKRISEFAGKGDKTTRKDRAAIAEFYAERDFQPLWTDASGLTSVAISLIDRISRAEEDGLSSSDYPTILPAPRSDMTTIAQAELRLFEAILHYARDAQGGRINPASVSKTIKLRPSFPEPAEVIKAMAGSKAPVKTLDGYNPPHAGFRALKAELASLRAPVKETEEEQHVIVPEGETMYVGYKDPRVAVLRERLNVPAVSDENPNYFGKAVEAAVRTFQRENGLVSDGLVGPKTLRTINGGKSSINRIPDIIANMERWRWMDRDMGNLHIVANIPSFEVSINKNGKSIHRTRSVVGKTKHKTPVFSDKMEFVVVNPYWNVPYSIASKKLLPNIIANPSYVHSKNYEILRGNKVINPTSVNWNPNSFRSYRIRQKPGSRNALGAVKFLFPNKHAIYFHDTPSKNLFQRATRAFSHGCVRLRNPFEFGDVLMRETKAWKNGRLEGMLGPKERWIKLDGDEQIPVHLTYFTAVTGSDGKIEYKSDVYGHNARMKRLLGLI